MNIAEVSWMVNTAPGADQRQLHAPSDKALEHFAVEPGAHVGSAHCDAVGIWALPALPQSRVLRRCRECCRAFADIEDGTGSPGRVSAELVARWREHLLVGAGEAR